jgi:hypothetical protein
MRDRVSFIRHLLSKTHIAASAPQSALLASAVPSRGGTARISNLGTVLRARIAHLSVMTNGRCNFDPWHDGSKAVGVITSAVFARPRRGTSQENTNDSRYGMAQLGEFTQS